MQQQSFVKPTHHSCAPVQVQAADGSWRDISLGPHQVAVLAGYTLSYATGGSVKTCRHRVVSGMG